MIIGLNAYFRSVRENTVGNTFTRNLSLGIQGRDVEELQNHLIKFGYLVQSGQLDPFTLQPLAGVISTSEKGIFGPDVESALYQYQVRLSIPPTGTLTNETIDTIAMPRCGCLDTVRTTNLDSKWNYRNIKYRFDQFPSQLSRAQVSDAVAAATALWSAIVPLNFIEVEGPADTSVKFVRLEHGDGSPFDGKGGVLAHATYPPNNHVHFDDDESWNVAPPIQPTDQDLVTQAAHEFGHIIGLSHSSDPTALMYPAPMHEHRYLSPDDISRAQSIYSARSLDMYLQEKFYGVDPIFRDGDLFTIRGTGDGLPGFACYNTPWMAGVTGVMETMVIFKEPKTGFDSVIRDGDRVNIQQSNEHRWWYVMHNELFCDAMGKFKWTFSIRKTTKMNPSDPNTLDDILRVGDNVRIQNVTRSEHSTGVEWIEPTLGNIFTITL